MRLIFKQRLFSWFDSYDIYDEAGNTVFTVEGQLSWGHCLKIFASDGSELGTVKEKVLTLFPKFELYLGDRYIGSVKKRFTLFRNVYDIDCRGWPVNGDVFGWDYTVISVSYTHLLPGIAAAMLIWKSVPAGVILAALVLSGIVLGLVMRTHRSALSHVLSVVISYAVIAAAAYCICCIVYYGGISNGTAAVSYPHLDVYKRQLFMQSPKKT